MASLAYFLIAVAGGMAMDHWFRWVLLASAPASMVAYMAWSIRESKKQDWLPPDPRLGRGPDPFLSRSGPPRTPSSSKPENDL